MHAHERTDPSLRVFVVGALVLGFGLGGLADGIVLHQVLQWHNLVSAQVTNETLPGLQDNLFWDGVFHLATTALVVAGVLVLWATWQSSAHAAGNAFALIGLALVGWGAFHVVDQLLFHVLLNLHDIRQESSHVALYNWGFFVVGLALAGGGWVVWRTRGRVGEAELRERSR